MIKLLYAGSLYGDRTLQMMFGPLRAALTKGIADSEGIRFHVCGNIEAPPELEEASDIKDCFIFHGFVKYDELRAHLAEADVLVLFVTRHMDYSVPYKFYDYMAVGHPVFAIGPRGSQMERLLAELGCGEYADMDDTASIDSKFLKLVNNLKEYSCHQVNQYTWSALAQRYLEFIDQVVADSRTSSISVSVHIDNAARSVTPVSRGATFFIKSKLVG